MSTPTSDVADPILTVAQMRAAEQALIDAKEPGGETVATLMERAGSGAAEWVWRLAARRPVTVLCGPGNNGGDGYVIARELARRGAEVTVVAPLEPRTEAAAAARAAYAGPVADRGRGGVLVDGLFGSGLARPLEPAHQALLVELARHHGLRIALDLPSGVDSDRGVPLNPGLPAFDVTLALGAWKFAHWLMPAAALMGARRLVPIGVGPVAGAAALLPRPRLAAPASDAHKYSRGLVLVVGGTMAGAALMACEAAMRSGAGAVRLSAGTAHPSASPDVILKTEPLGDLLADDRTGAVLVGPGLGRDGQARERLAEALAAGRPSVIDADALALLYPALVDEFAVPPILTPHEGELARLAESFGLAASDKLGRARELAAAAKAVVVAKGPDTVIAAPDGRTVLAPSPSAWLAVAGTGDVLAGIATARLAAGGDPFVAACEAVWLHGEAARIAGPAFVASELAHAVAKAYAAAL
jgi:hydroxyethylthiazole kinase-like uncharacterized protein yjeF